MRKRWVLLPVAAAVLAIGVFTTGAVLAHGTTGADSFTSRVATILGLDEPQVQDAFDQARRDMRDEAILSKLDGMVADGTITQDRADEYLVWYQSKPQDFPGFGLKGHGMGRHRGFRFGHEGPPPVASTPPAQGS